MTTKSILITGCSSGIGNACALALKQRDWQVFATARKSEDVAALSELGLQAISCDVCDEMSVKQTVEAVLTHTHGRLDALFNNAGYGLIGALEDLEIATISAQFDTNVLGPLRLIKAVLPTMRTQGYGRIINNSSVLAHFTMPLRGAYCASKAALDSCSDALRQELRGTGIEIVTLAPGPIRSQFRYNAKTLFETLQDPSQSAHAQAYQALQDYFAHTQQGHARFTLEPEAVVKQLLKALTQRHPKAYYFIGYPTRLIVLLRKLLGAKAFARVLARINSP